MSDQTSQSWHANDGLWQTVVNAHEIPDRRQQRLLERPVAVLARVEWERDGVELVTTTAHGWAGRLAYVSLDDPRARVRWVWLDAGDVERLRMDL